MPNFKNKKVLLTEDHKMSSTVVFKCPVVKTPITDLSELEMMNRIAESAFRSMEKKPKTRNP